MRGLAALLLASLVAWSGHAVAGEGEARLQLFLEGTQTLSADFEQRLLGDTRAGPREARGTLLISRPGRFRWDYASPYRQLIVGDGERLWLFDPDLEQVTVRTQAEALGNSPAQLLSGSLDLATGYEIVDAGSDGDIASVDIRSRGADEEFASIRLGFSARGLATMHMVDNLGNETLIEFRNVEKNLEIDPGRFSFTPPPGVDVIGE